MSPRRPRFRGLYAAVHTPFNRGGRFFGARVAEQYTLLREAQIDGVFLCGTAGEGSSLTVPERRAVLDTWVGVTEARLPIIAQVGAEPLPDAIRLAKHAAGAGASAVAARSPSYHRPACLEDLVEYLAQIAEAAPELPFLFYDAPDFTGVRFPTDQVLEWGRLRIPNLVGVKYTSDDVEVLARCLALGEELDVLVGYEHLLLKGLELGARGAIGVTFSFAAPLYRRLIQAQRAGDQAAAAAEQTKVVELLDALRPAGVIPASKALMALLGVDCGKVRLPLSTPTTHELRTLHERVREMDVFARPLATPAEAGR